MESRQPAAPQGGGGPGAVGVFGGVGGQVDREAQQGNGDHRPEQSATAAHGRRLQSPFMRLPLVLAALAVMLLGASCGQKHEPIGALPPFPQQATQS